MKIFKIFLILVLVLSVLMLTSGCKNKQVETMVSQESSQSTDSIQTSLLSNNSTDTTESTVESTPESSIDTSSESNDTLSSVDSVSSNVETPELPTTSDVSSEVVSSEVTSFNDSELKYSKKAVTKVLDALKTGDFETAQASLTGDRPPKESLGFDDATVKKVKSILAELDYEIISAKRIDSSDAIITVKITALNFKKIYKSYVKEASDIAKNSPTLTSEQIRKKIDEAFLDALKEGKKSPKEKTVELTVVGHGKDWTLKYSNDFATACLGGINQVAEAL